MSRTRELMPIDNSMGIKNIFHLIEQWFDTPSMLTLFAPEDEIPRMITKDSFNYTARQHDEYFDLIVDVPGFGKEDLEVSISGGHIRIKGFKEIKDKRKLVINFSFYCPILSKELELEVLDAKVTKGQLIIKVPKLKRIHTLKLT